MSRQVHAQHACDLRWLRARHAGDKLALRTSAPMTWALRAQCARDLGSGCAHSALNQALIQCTVCSHCLGNCSWTLFMNTVHRKKNKSTKFLKIFLCMISYMRYSYCVTPRTRGSVDYPSTRGIQVKVGLPDATLENRAESPLYGELYPNTKPINNLHFPVPNSPIYAIYSQHE